LQKTGNIFQYFSREKLTCHWFGIFCYFVVHSRIKMLQMSDFSEKPEIGTDLEKP